MITDLKKTPEELLTSLINEANFTTFDKKDIEFGQPEPYSKEGDTYRNTAIIANAPNITAFQGPVTFYYRRIKLSDVFANRNTTFETDAATLTTDEVVALINARFDYALAVSDFVNKSYTVPGTAELEAVSSASLFIESANFTFAHPTTPGGDNGNGNEDDEMTYLYTFGRNARVQSTTLDYATRSFTGEIYDSCGYLGAIVKIGGLDTPEVTGDLNVSDLEIIEARAFATTGTSLSSVNAGESGFSLPYGGAYATPESYTEMENVTVTPVETENYNGGQLDVSFSAPADNDFQNGLSYHFTLRARCRHPSLPNAVVLLSLEWDQSIEDYFAVVTLDPDYSEVITGLNQALCRPAGSYISGNFDSVGTVTTHRYARILPDGSPDPTFSVPADGSTDIQMPITILPDYAGGIVGIGSSWIQRFDTTGQLLSSVQAPFGLLNQPMVQDTTGRYLTYTYSSPYINRVLANGTKDTTFAPDTFSGSFDGLLALPNGKFLIWGGLKITSKATPTKSRQYLAVIDQNGVLDLSYPSFNLASAPSNAWVMSDGSVYLTGVSTIFGSAVTKALVKLKPDLTLDTSFTCPDMTSQYNTLASINKVLELANSKILVAGGIAKVDNVQVRNLTLLNSDGSRDTNFSALPVGEGSYIIQYAMFNQAATRLVVGGSLYYTDPHTGIQYNNDLSLIYGA